MRKSIHSEYRSAARVVAGACLIALACAPAFRAAGRPAKIIDGTPRIVINGRQWSWGMGFDEEVTKSVGITNWTYRSGEFNDVPLDSNLKWTGDWFRQLDYRNEATPVILITYGSTGRVDGPHDTAHINLGVRKLRKFTDTLMAQGIDWVIFTTRHKRVGRYRNRLTAYDDSNDTLVLKEFSRVMGERLWADALTPSAKAYPYTVADDLEHPRGPLWKIYATSWLKAMYARDNTAPPAVLDANVESATSKEMQSRAYLTAALSAPGRWDTLRIGQQVELAYDIVPQWMSMGDAHYEVRLIGHTRNVGGLFVLDDSIRISSSSMKFTVTIPDSAPVALYGTGPGGIKYPLQVDSAQFQLIYRYNNGGTYRLTKAFRLADRSATVLARPEGRPGDIAAVAARQARPLLVAPREAGPGSMATPLGRSARPGARRWAAQTVITTGE